MDDSQRASDAIERIRAKHDRFSDLQDSFGSALTALDGVFAAGSYLPVIGDACKEIRSFTSKLGDLSETSQEACRASRGPPREKPSLLASSLPFEK